MEEKGLYKRTDKNYVELLMSLVVNGYSETQANLLHL